MPRSASAPRAARPAGPRAEQDVSSAARARSRPHDAAHAMTAPTHRRPTHRPPGRTGRPSTLRPVPAARRATPERPARPPRPAPPRRAPRPAAPKLVAVPKPPNVARRLAVMLLAMLIVLVVIAGKLVTLQGSDGAHYDRLSRN